MFKRMLIANRGEIACRIMRTAQKMGIHCIAVYSSIDENARHVQMADEAYLLGDAPSVDSYLCGDKIIAIAKQSGAEAIHPGYGFLSENAAFAKACQKAGIVFIGPTAEAILTMGDKSKAKEIMEKAGVPCTPGYHGNNQDADFLLNEAKKIGFPVLIKAAMGGGGKGMRKVDEAKAFKEALASAQREALASFADKTVLLEKYLVNPRHIEIQVMADNHNEVVYLFERDCSIQRRHQKILEEAPGIKLSDKLRSQIGNTAILAAKAIEYRGAGTLEFLLDENDQFYFMEMNTRLQVEHPVTEMITGLDLVAWQLKIADGKGLPCQQKDINVQGHAIEVRLYAEDPSNDFLPATGQIHYLAWPVVNDKIRIDSGIQQNDTISSYYDPMMAKLIVHGDTREDAIHLLKNALDSLHIIGLKNNRQFLQKLISLPDYVKGKLNTSFIPDHEAQFKQVETLLNEAILCGAALHAVLTVSCQLSANEDIFSPWQHRDGFRLQLPYQRRLQFKYQGQEYSVIMTYHSISNYTAEINHSQYAIQVQEQTAERLRFVMNDNIHNLCIISYKQQRWIIAEDQEYNLQLIENTHVLTTEPEQTSHLNAPMPGAIIAVNVKSGDKVQKDDCLMVMEAMKMEHSIYAPHAGTIREVFYAPGDLVDEG
ncbi:MAG: acetyl-CoA carboxylase biotin carboxylase subunit, partial [Gammaproteobacteria bacterium]|nr:acetyl-CoA carboxylase biotin carboxylase subunit [Gammaproteobacteria bacterium]